MAVPFTRTVCQSAHAGQPLPVELPSREGSRRRCAGIPADTAFVGWPLCCGFQAVDAGEPRLRTLAHRATGAGSFGCVASGVDRDAHEVSELRSLKQTRQLRFALGPVAAEGSPHGRRDRRLPVRNRGPCSARFAGMEAAAVWRSAASDPGFGPDH
jgi:hypothetical protein